MSEKIEGCDLAQVMKFYHLDFNLCGFPHQPPSFYDTLMNDAQGLL